MALVFSGNSRINTLYTLTIIQVIKFITEKTLVIIRQFTIRKGRVGNILLKFKTLFENK